jgi:ubiquinone/menaquinone biosynthesis C-methylase UbiE
MDQNTRPEIDFAAKTHESYARSLKYFWKEAPYRRVVAEAKETGANDVEALERNMRRSPAYQFYGWLERRSQQVKYQGRWGMVPTLARQREKLSRILAAGATRSSERLHLDPKFKIPDYVTETDIHQHPNGIWSSDDAPFVYEWATGSVSFSMLDPNRPLDWYAALMRDHCDPQLILDIGCTVGAMSRAFKRAMPKAEIHACDVSGPAVQLAHLRAVEADQEIDYWQMNGEELSFEDDRFDLVTSHWLIHEVPPKALRRIMREGRRVLKSGGTFAMFDMYLTPGGIVDAWLLDGYAARNNEPFMHPLRKLDMEAELSEAGFRDVRIELSKLQATPDVLAGELPESRTHYMTVITAIAL